MSKEHKTIEELTGELLPDVLLYLINWWRDNNIELTPDVLAVAVIAGMYSFRKTNPYVKEIYKLSEEERTKAIIPYVLKYMP